MRPREATELKAVAANRPTGSAVDGPFTPDSPPRELASSAFSLHDVIAEATARFGAAGLGKGIAVLIKAAPNVPDVVIGDEGCARDVLFGLIDSAVASTDTGEVVASIRCDAAGPNRVLLHAEVSDTGNGAPGDLTGLVALVDLMDGQVARATAPGLGSTASLSLPLDLPAR